MGMTIWSRLYINRWESRCSELAIRWDNYTDEYNIDNIRPEFKGEWKRSKITGKYEEYFPNNKRLFRYFISVLLALPLLSVSVFIITCYLNISGVLLSEKSKGSMLKMNYLSSFAEPE